MYFHTVANTCNASELAVDFGTVLPDMDSSTSTIYNQTCDPGYSGDWTGTLLCSPTGSWLNTPAVCTANICNASELVVSAGAVVPSSDSPTATIYNVTCDAGHTGDTSGSLLCGPTGNWINKQNPCKSKFTIKYVYSELDRKKTSVTFHFSIFSSDLLINYFSLFLGIFTFRKYM